MGLARRGLAKLFRFDTCHQCRHQFDQACCWTGALRGRSPELQWSVVNDGLLLIQS